MPALPRASLGRLPGLLALAATLALAAPAEAQSSAQGSADRFYDVFDTGQKIGYSRVQWRPSKWEGRESVHDTTLVVNRGVRDMAGITDAFDTKTLLEIERGPEGELYRQSRRVTEGQRRSSEELRWTGSGYQLVTRVGADPAHTQEIALEKPVYLDAEAFLCAKVKAGKLRLGQRLTYRGLDVRAKGAVDVVLEVLDEEEIPAPGGKVDCLVVLETDPRSGTRTRYWLSKATGTFVRLRDDQGNHLELVDQLKALKMPSRPATYSITVDAQPRLPRVFNADELKVSVHVKAAADRAMPEYPESPWSKVLGMRGDDEIGYVLTVQLRAYDPSTPKAEFPVDRERFEDDLEPTALMPSDHASLRAEARRVIGQTRSLRQAAFKLARHVHTSLRKESPPVASSTALEILRDPRGDCSEHCVLFVALCRAAGIPARRCSGYVNIGDDWGAHDWAEVWLGEWIGADPTTGEIGTKARYLFFGYPDRPKSYPERLRSQTAGRIQIVGEELVEDGKRFSLARKDLVVSDPKAGHYLQVTSGIELKGLPPAWRVRMNASGSVSVSEGSFGVDIRALADQGDSLSGLFGRVTGAYAGRPAWVQSWGSGARVWVHSRRRFLELTIRGGTPAQRSTLEQALAPTFQALGPRGEKEAPSGE